jgi:hypothetical protein
VWRSGGKPCYYNRPMKNKIVAAVLILLASVAAFTLAPYLLVAYLAGGLGAGVGASIVRAREAPLRVWTAAWLCHGAAFVSFVSCAGVMVSFGAPSFAFVLFVLAHALVPTLLYGSAALVLSTSS